MSASFRVINPGDIKEDKSAVDGVWLYRKGIKLGSIDFRQSLIAYGRLLSALRQRNGQLRTLFARRLPSSRQAAVKIVFIGRLQFAPADCDEFNAQVT